MKKPLVFVCLFLLPLLSASADPFIIGTGGVSGIYYPSIEILCTLFNEKYANTDCQAQSTAGSLDNIERINSGELTFAVVQSDLLYQAYSGTQTFAGSAKNNLRSIMALYPELLALVTKQQAAISVLDDIKGKRIHPGSPGSGTAETVKLLLQNADIGLDSFTAVNDLKTEDCPAALKSGKIDGYFYMVGHPAKNIRQAAAENTVSLVIIDGPPVYKMLEEYPYYVKDNIPAGTYRNVNGETPTVGVKAVLITREDTPDNLVTQLLHSVVEQFETFRSRHPAPDLVQKKDLAVGLGTPLHPAAKSYYAAGKF